jgi:hypothetical protein
MLGFAPMAYETCGMRFSLESTVLAAAFAIGAIGATAACDASRFDEERIAAPAAYDARGGEIVSEGDRARDEQRIAALCPHGHVSAAPRTIAVAVQLVPHPIGESSPVTRDRIPIFERRIPFTCTLPPVALDAGDSASATDPALDAGADAALTDGAGAPPVSL